MKHDKVNDPLDDLDEDITNESELRKELAKMLGNKKVSCNLAQLLSDQGRKAEAIAVLRNASKHNPRDSEIACELFHVFYDSDDFVNAKKSLFRFVKENETARVLGILADSLRHLGKDETAIDLYRAAIFLNPAREETYNNMAISLNTVGRYAEAEDVCTARLKKFPRDFELQVNLIEALLGLNKLDSALRVALRVVELHPNEQIAHAELGDVYHELHRLNDARCEFEKALQIDSNYNRAHLALGTVLDKLGDFVGGAEQFSAILITEPDAADVHNNLGVALDGMGHFEEALLEYEQAIKLDPKHDLYKHNRQEVIDRIAYRDSSVK